MDIINTTASGNFLHYSCHPGALFCCFWLLKGRMRSLHTVVKHFKIKLLKLIICQISPSEISGPGSPKSEMCRLETIPDHLGLVQGASEQTQRDTSSPYFTKC